MSRLSLTVLKSSPYELLTTKSKTQEGQTPPSGGHTATWRRSSATQGTLRDCTSSAYQ